MSLGLMSPVEFKKWPYPCVDFRGLAPYSVGRPPRRAVGDFSPVVRLRGATLTEGRPWH